MADLLLPTEGEGADLRELMRERLGIPGQVKWFEVRFAPDEPVTVRCEFYAQQQAEPAEPGDDDPAPGAGTRGLDG